MTLDSLIDPLVEELRQALRSVNPEDVDQLRRAILSARRIFVTGKGRSELQVKAFAMRLMHLGLHAHVIGDVTTPGITSGDILLIGSGSGRTASLLSYAEHAHRLHIPVLLITAAQESPIHEMAACIVRITAPTPKIYDNKALYSSMLPMGSLFEQALSLLLEVITLMLMHDLDLDSGQMFGRHANLE